MTDEAVFCQRCSRLLQPGQGNFYTVKIEAMADPSPPVIEEPPDDIAGEIARAIEEIAEHSEQELMDQVRRRLTIHLCTPCYRDWIENPAGER